MSCYLCCCIDEHLPPSIPQNIVQFVQNEKYSSFEGQKDDEMKLDCNNMEAESRIHRVPIDIESCSRKNKHLLQSSPSYREAVAGNIADFILPLDNSR